MQLKKIQSQKQLSNILLLWKCPSYVSLGFQIVNVFCQRKIAMLRNNHLLRKKWLFLGAVNTLLLRLQYPRYVLGIGTHYRQFSLAWAHWNLSAAGF